MRRLRGDQIRDTFLRFFQERHHRVIPGAPLVPVNDPTLLFINSGMAPLKKYFLGLEQPPERRLCNYQACIRTRDIDDVGDRHHLTLFEMLGSWSIGDYYKQTAVELAWELLTDRFQFPAEKLFMTVYAGGPSGLAADEETARAWQSVGVPEERIVFLGEDNFWGPAGDTGPCGPCTEVFFDTGERFGAAYRPGGPFDTKRRYIEIWNAGVFMEFNKNADGSFVPLPLKSVDTGSGLERMEFVLNGCESVYEVAGLRPLVDAVAARFRSPRFGEREHRILADHLRAATFILSEDVKPSNEGQGYIPRRLIRRCLSIGLRSDEPSSDFSAVVDLVVDRHRDAYPHLAGKKDAVIAAIEAEARDFEPVLRRGLKLIEKELAARPAEAVVGAPFLFDMVTTHGIPLELIADVAAGAGRSIDEAGYRALFAEHQNVSREGKAPAGEAPASRRGAKPRLAGLPATEFLGYREVEARTPIVALFRGDQAVDRLSAGEEGSLVTERTPFYGEAGGQVGDQGTLSAEGASAKVLQTTKEEGVFLHHVAVEAGALERGTAVTLRVDPERRRRVQANHSATHLLHAALRQLLGPTAVQKGSLVEADRLRFDFQHGSALTQEQLRELERRVNQWIRENVSTATTEMDVQTALGSGAIAMFGEKYGDRVRVVRFGDHSTELCGGTHVRATGDVGVFVITAEGSVAKGIRRLEAVTGEAAIGLVQERGRILQEVAGLLGTHPQGIAGEVAKLRSQKGAAKVDAPQGRITLAKEQLTQVADGLSVWVARADAENEALKREIDERLSRGEADVLVAVGAHDGRVNLTVAVSERASKRVRAERVLKDLLGYIEGRGGGKPTFAQGAGKRLEGMDTILEHAPGVVRALLESERGS